MMRAEVMSQNNCRYLVLFVVSISCAFLSGCAQVQDTLTCQIFTSHDNKVYEAITYDNAKNIERKLQKIAADFDMKFARGIVPVYEIDRTWEGIDMQICNRYVSVLASNLTQKNGFTFYAYAIGNRHKNEVDKIIAALKKYQVRQKN